MPQLSLQRKRRSLLASVSDAGVTDGLGPLPGRFTRGTRATTAGSAAARSKPGSGKLIQASPESARSDYLGTRNRRMVTAPDRVLLTGSRSILGRLGGEKRMPSPSSTGSTYTRSSSTSSRRRHWAGHVGAEDLQVLAARGAAGRGDRFPDVTGKVRDLRARRLWRPMCKDEHGSGKGVVHAARLLGFHPVAYLGGPPADEHGAGGRRDLPELVRRHEIGELATSAPVHRVAGGGDEAVKRHRPVHDHLAVSGTRIAHPGSSPRQLTRTQSRHEAAGYRFVAV